MHKRQRIRSCCVWHGSLKEQQTPKSCIWTPVKSSVLAKHWCWLAESRWLLQPRPLVWLMDSQTLVLSLCLSSAHHLWKSPPCCILKSMFCLTKPWHSDGPQRDNNPSLFNSKYIYHMSFWFVLACVWHTHSCMLTQLPISVERPREESASPVPCSLILPLFSWDRPLPKPGARLSASKA